MVDFHHQPTTPLAQKDYSSLLPERIGPYKIESFLVAGGESLLYIGLEEEAHKLVVIKLLPKEIAKSYARKERFKKESAFLKELSHPNIATFEGEGEWEGNLYIAIEFIRGISLKQFILQRSLSLRSAISFLLQVSYAVLYLHTQGIIHRDLKPENLLITENAEVKVVDFGLSALVGEEALALQVGTPAYMAPELRHSRPVADVRSDIYSIGIILYELVLGRICLGYVDLSLLPKHLKGIIEKATHKDKNRRYSDLVELIADLSIYLKEDLIDKDQNLEDQLKERLESYEKAKQLLTPPFELKQYDLMIDFALPKLRQEGTIGLAQYKLQDSSQLLLFFYSEFESTEALLHIQHLKTASECLFRTMNEQQVFSLSEYLRQLESFTKYRLSLSLLHVSTIDNEYHLFSFGNSTIYHIKKDLETIHPHLAFHRQFGQKEGSFPTPISDRLDSGDLLLLPVPGFTLQFDKAIPRLQLKNLLEILVDNQAPLLLGVKRVE